MDDIQNIYLTKQYNTQISELPTLDSLVLDDIPGNATLADARTIVNSNNEKLRTLIIKAGSILDKINNIINYYDELLTNRNELEVKLAKIIDYINRHEDRQSR